MKKKIIKENLIVLLLLLISSTFILSCNNNSKEESGKSVEIKQNVNAEDFYNELINNPTLIKKSAGEPFAWNACKYAPHFVKAYKAWHDTSWLNYGVKYYDFLLSHTTTAPDGYKGFIGPNMRSKSWSNEQVSDALLMKPLLGFAELVLNDEKLRPLYEKKANEYVEFAKKHAIEKWDKRGLYHEIGEYADYIFGNDFIDSNDPSKWEEGTSKFPLMSQKFNIGNKLGQVSLRLYRITGDEFYRDKAEKLFYRMKSEFQYFDNHYVWFYWTPFYENDILFDKNKTLHWANVHPFRSGYKNAEVQQIVEAFHSGVVFSETDMKRIVNINMEVMWNKDFENPEYISCNGKNPDTLGVAKFHKSKGHGNPMRNVGQLWYPLIDFDERVRKLYEQQLVNVSYKREMDKWANEIAKAYYYNYIAKKEANYKRKFADGLKVEVKDVPLGNSGELVLATVIPYIIKKGNNSTIISKASASGLLKIDLYSSDGKNKIVNLFSRDISIKKGGNEMFQMFKWNGIDSESGSNYSGNYRIRWTLNNHFREREIKIIN